MIADATCAAESHGSHAGWAVAATNDKLDHFDLRIWAVVLHNQMDLTGVATKVLVTFVVDTEQIVFVSNVFVCKWAFR